MWAQVSFVLSQITHLADGQTDGRHSRGYSVRCIRCSRTAKWVKISRNYSTVVYRLPHFHGGESISERQKSTAQYLASED